MIFTNDKEVNIAGSHVLKSFQMINSVKAFLDLGLPIRRYTCPGGVTSDDPEEIHNNKEDRTIAFEIDLSYPKRIQRILGLKTLDCLPVIWCFQDLQSVMWSVSLE